MTPSGPGWGSGIARVLSDERLTRRAVKGDERAFTAIFRRYHQSLYGYCRAILGNPEDAQDALQNTMVRVLRALPGEERRIELRPWLYRIAHNESIELLRRRRDSDRLDDEPAAPEGGPAEVVATRERLRGLLRDLSELPERQRGALVMRELAGLDFAEIAEALDTSAAVARQTLYEARVGLRRMDEGRQMSCATVTRALSDGDRRVIRRRDLRAHLRSCVSCRDFGVEIDQRERGFRTLSPLPATAAAGLLHGLLGGHGGAGSAGALGGGTAQSLGAAATLKGAATVAVVAAIGVGSADRSGLIDAGLPGGSPEARAQSQARPQLQPRPASIDFTAAGRDSAGPRSATAGADGPAWLAAKGRSAGRLGATRVTKSAAEQPPPLAVAEPGVEATATVPASREIPATHRGVKGYEKRFPGAATQGRQTAASHANAGLGKVTSHGNATARAHPEHPAAPAPPAGPEHPRGPAQAHPEHPATPALTAPGADPAAESEASSPTSAPAAPAPQAQAKDTAPAAAALPPAPSTPETGEPG